MLLLDGYQILEERPSRSGLKVFSAIHTGSASPVFIHLLPAGNTPPTRMETLYRRCLPLKKPISRYLPRVYAVKKTEPPAREGIACIVEDVPGLTLWEYIRQKNPIPVATFLDIALQLVTAVKDLHKAGMIHKRLTSGGIVIDPETGQVRICDFAFLSEGGALLPEDADPGRLGLDLLFYISPEQTGRMSCAVDHRTDFYTLGIIFYELITGSPPFTGRTVVELIHAHMAKNPVPLTSIRPDVGETISNIILKLLAKSPDERYQSTHGLRFDLARCRERLAADGHIPVFAPARYDISPVFRMPDRICGREIEMAMLIDAYERVRQGNLGITLISGYPGIGKTRLVFELKKYILRKGGYFISGRYDQFHQDIPYSGVLQAFQEMVRQILSEPADRIGKWRRKMAAMLGPNAGLLMGVIPELELILGKQPKASGLTPAEEQNRFRLVFEKFLQVFTGQGHTLVLFIDDMQWADTAGLQLMEAFFTGTRTRNFYFIGAYRDHEIPTDHPLPVTISALRQKGVLLDTITLKPISETGVGHLLAEALHESRDYVRPLAGIVYDKTGGNPFFIRQFFQSIHHDGLLAYDYEKGRWRWDTAGIAAAAITDNVVDFMAEKVLKLTDNARKTLKLAACIGNRFELGLLSQVAAKPVNTLLNDLREPIGLGFVVPSRGIPGPDVSLKIPSIIKDDVARGPAEGPAYEFLHDKVRQAVYLLIPEDKKAALHLRIGRFLYENTDPKETANRIFPIVSHLNQGRGLLSRPNARRRVARLNLMAGKKARDAAAYSQAMDYLGTAESLLPSDAWRRAYPLIFDIKKCQMACAFLQHNVDEAEALFQVLVERAASDQDRAVIYNQKMIMLAGLARHEEALSIGLSGLKLMGESLPKRAGIPRVLATLGRLKLRLYRTDIDSLLALPEIKDPRRLLILEMMMNLGLSAYFCQPYFATFLALKIFELTLTYGNSKVSPFAYVIYGSALCAVFGDYRTGRRFGELALKADRRFGGAGMTAKVLLYYASAINIWGNHMHQGIDDTRRGIRYALEAGDVNYALYHIQSLIIFMTAGGKTLDEIAGECDRYYAFVEQSKDTGALNYLISIRQFVKCLKGQTLDPLSLDDDFFREERHVENMVRDDIRIILFRHYLIKLRLFYIMGAYKEALAAARKCAALKLYHMGTILIPEYWFYYALVLSSLFDSAPALKQALYYRKIRFFCNRLKRLSVLCPENFMDKYLLVAAETARVSKKDRRAMQFYHRSIISARDNRLTQDHAITNEAAGRFYMACGYDEIARGFMEQALEGYHRWGAVAKVDHIRKTFAGPVIPYLRPEALRSARSMDFDAIMDSLRMISTEIVLDDLLKKLMKIVVENAGARKVQFLTLKKDRMYLQAEIDEDAPDMRLHKSVPADSRIDVFLPVLNYVKRTRTYIVLNDAGKEGDFVSHPYVKKYRPKSVLCLPVIRHGRLVALLYLENDITPGVFTPERIEVLRLLASQAGVSLENARLYENVILNERRLRKISAKREEEASRYQAQLRRLSSELSLTEERERRRIARDIHDRIGHTLTTASMKLRLMQNATTQDGSDRLDEINSLIDRSIQDTQSLTFELSPPVLYDLGLEAAIDWLAEQTQQQHGIPVEFVDDGSDKPMDESLRILLFQAVRELLFNVVKHSRAKKALVSISREEDNIRIVIQDNGVGFGASKKDSAVKRGGFGLFSIQERLKQQGGRLEIKSDPAVGSRVTIISPMTGSDT